MGKPKKKRDRASKQYIIAAWIFIAILVVAAFFLMRDQKKKLNVQSSGNVSSIQTPKQRSTGYAGPSSPEFNNALIEKGKKDAAVARQKGQSFVAPMTNGEEPPKDNQFNILRKAKRYEKKQEVVIKPQPIKTVDKPARKAPKRQAPPNEEVKWDDQKVQKIRASLKSQLAMISNKMVYKGHAAMEYKPVEAANEEPVQQTASGSEESAASTSFNMVKDLRVRPGDVFYSSNMQTLNTDTPAPVATVEILAGPMKNSIAEGTFELLGETIRFTFYQLTDKDGQRYEMKGFAVDPATKFAGVASEVDHHMFSRWAGLAASSLLSGWADAVAKSGTATSTNVAGGIITSETPEYSLSDKFWIASGEVAKNLSDVAKANYNRAVTAWLKSNHPVGVLIIDLKPIN